MNTHHKHFLLTLACLLLIVAGAVLLVNQSQSNQTEEEFGDLMVDGIMEDNKECLVQAWGEARYDAVLAGELLTEVEVTQFNLCVNY